MRLNQSENCGLRIEHWEKYFCCLGQGKPHTEDFCLFLCLRRRTWFIGKSPTAGNPENLPAGSCKMGFTAAIKQKVQDGTALEHCPLSIAATAIIMRAAGTTTREPQDQAC